MSGVELENKDCMAEGEGFEPPVGFPLQRFSRPPVSTAHTSLRAGHKAALLFSLQHTTRVHTLCSLVHTGCTVRVFQGLHGRNTGRVEPVVLDVGLARDADVGMAQDGLDHDVRDAELMQVGG